MGVDTREIAVRQRFSQLVEAITHFHWRRDISVEEIGSPQRIAPHSYALEADLGPEGEVLGSGRLVLLHDPDGNDAWQGTHRFVSLVHADSDLEMAADPLIGEVGWSWFTEALEEHGAGYTAPAGTVTVVSSRFFGEMNNQPDRAEVEIRTSWTPLLNEAGQVAAHLEAWQQLMCQVAGLPPAAEARTWRGMAARMTDARAADHEIDPESGLPILSMPHDGLPPLVDTDEALDRCIARLGAGSGPLAIDTERAQSFRYSAKAYLLQFRRGGSGTWLIDPEAFEPDGGGLCDLGALREATESAEWIIHAATQDLPCLVELGLRPTTLFDTELAGRLLGLPKVGLGHMVEQFFGLHLLKEHSAADWSTRPLPEDWVAYAALDVELLVELRDRLDEELQRAGKREWAAEEFAHLVEVYQQPAPPRAEPWRRTGGSHLVHSRRGMALVRELWQARDEIARELDKAPGKILQDKAISELASSIGKGDAKPLGDPEMDAVMGFRRRTAKRYRDRWLEVCQAVARMPADELPDLRVPHAGPPQPRSWQHARPDAWQRWQRVRPAANQLAERIAMPPENLVSPEALRWLVWDPLPRVDEQSVSKRLAAHEVRPWQRALLSPVLVAALNA